MAHREHRIDQGGRQGRRHRPQVLRRAAEAGEPDQGDPLVHRPEGRRHRVLAGRRDRLGHRCCAKPRPPRSRSSSRTARSTSRTTRCTSPSWARTSSRKAARPAAGWSRRRRATTGPINIVELQGTVGSAPAIDRKKGFEEIIKAEPKFKIIRSQTGDFTRAKGKEVMEAFLKAEGKKINVLFAHNDDMAIGAIQAIEEAGHEAGQGHHHRLDRRREGRVRGDDGRQAERHRSNAARCSGRS